jgi:ABC-type nickel/cobalt efflux system permease component RcnA
MNFFRIQLFFLLFSSTIFACAMCKAQVPDVAVSITEQHTQNKIELDFIWSYKKYFSAESLLAYDQDRDGKLSEFELRQITTTFTDYLSQDSYLTFIKYVENVDGYDRAKYLDFNISGVKTYFESDQMHFQYHLSLPLTPKQGHELYITLFDKQGFFKFKINKVTLQEAENNSTFITAGSTSFIPLSLGSDASGVSEPKHTVFQSDAKNIENNATGILGFLGKKLQQTKEHIFRLVKQIESEGSILAYFWLLAFSLLYGFIHALGPGHGKSLVAAYFLGNNRSVVKAFSIASLIGVVHTFSAFLLTFVIYFVLNTYMSTYFSNLESITIRISALIIIVIALYLLYKKIPKKEAKKPMWSATQPNQHAGSCSCGACQSRSTDLGIILSAGIVPCPGTITIFVFSLSLGAYLVGFLSAVFMSIGMSIVIFSAALLSIKVRQKSTQNHRLRMVLDYGSLLFILMLGVILFFMA